MKCIIFSCIIYVHAYSTDQNLVVLNPDPLKVQHSHELVQLDPPSSNEEDNTSALEGDEEFHMEKPLFEDPLDSDDIENDESAQEDLDDIGQSKLDYNSEEEQEVDGEQKVYYLQLPSNGHGKGIVVKGGDKIKHWNKWMLEIADGNKADVGGTNPHYYQPDNYPDFSRRFVPQYPYTEVQQHVEEAPDNKEIVPIPAPLELVKIVAKESALLERAKNHTEDFNPKAILRTGNYWNAVWKEEIDPKTALRTQNQVLNTIKAKIKPGSEFYDLATKLKKISPRLLYIINKK